MTSPENKECGYCGYPENKFLVLQCSACGHDPWFEVVKYPEIKLSGRNSSDLDSLVKFLDLEKAMDQEDQYFGEED